MQILIVWDRMGDYHRSRVKAYRNLYSNDKMITADLGAADNLYKWYNTLDESHYVLSNKKADAFDLWSRFQSFKKIVKNHKIDRVVLSGYGRKDYLIFTIWLKLNKIDTYIFAESWYRGNDLADSFKRLYLKYFIKGVFVSGKRAYKHFYKHLNYPKKRISTGYSVVDNAHFSFKRTLLEFQKSLANQPILLCVARYAEEKNLALLIRAFERSELSSKWILKIVGGGPLRDRLEETITNQKKVQLLNWQSYDDLPALYHTASCFVLPSKFEPWGLVVNEAMAASLPIIVSDACGCKPDLLGANGYSFQADSENELTKVLNKLNADNEEDLFNMGLNSFNCIMQFTPEIWSTSLNKLLI